MRPLACWDFGFESRQGRGCLSVVIVACCQVEVSATGQSVVQRSPTDCGVSERDREASIMRRPWPTGGCCATERKIFRLGLINQVQLGKTEVASDRQEKEEIYVKGLVGESKAKTLLRRPRRRRGIILKPILKT
jgi:hypothetical protein